ncbi:MAG: PilT/PilU family type 4a pilus ATPase [Gammaproteobacteria bacterium]|nr:PilT/PilU family type 4a pilus ATPase [Gammaproteobacteria bacterium]
MEFNSLLQLMCTKKASDLFISAGIPPSMKINGNVSPISNTRFTSEQAKKLIYDIMSPGQKRQFERHNEANFAISPDDIGRFRVNIYRHQNQVGMVLRRIETDVPSIEELHLPQMLGDISMYRHGLVLIVGATGSGKSSTLAAMINHRNKHSNGHIISIEDPIEYVHAPQHCIITQREVGIDTESFEVGLKNALRQAPNVIVIGEIRTKEALSQAMQFAETGHLCLATIHASNTNQVFDRIMRFFPDEQRKQISLDLSLSLKAIVAQRLIPTKDEKGRRVAIECLLNTSLVAKHILQNEIYSINNVIEKSNQLGMRTFDQSLYSLYKDGEISYEEALKNADSRNELRLRIKLSKKHDPDSTAMSNITLIEHNI